MDYIRQILHEILEEDDEEQMGLTSIRRIYERKEPLTYFSDQEFKLRFRLDKENAVAIIESLTPDLEYTSER